MTEIEFITKARFGDVKVRWSGKLASPEAAIESINAFIADAEKEEKDIPSIWVSLSGDDLNHLNLFLKSGFSMHRMKEGNVIVLNRWLRKESHTLPPAPFCYLGLGALCFNSKGQVLAVRENYKSGPGPWKLPGGLFDPKRDAKLTDAVVRECFEETGIKAEFEAVVCQRFTFNAPMFHKQDLYTICRLRALTEEIKFDPIEIADCQWWDADKFLEEAHPVVRGFLEPSLKNKCGWKETYNGAKGRDAWIYCPVSE